MIERIESALSTSEIAKRLEPKFHVGIFYPGQRGIASREGWLYEGKITEKGFSIRRVTPYKALYPMTVGTFSSEEGKTIVALHIDHQHFRHMHWIVYTAACAIGLAVAMALIFGRENGSGLLSSYLIPLSIGVGAFLIISIIKWISISRYRRDVAFLRKRIGDG